MKGLILFSTLLLINIAFLALLSLVGWCAISLIFPVVTYKQVFGASILIALFATIIRPIR
jgi:hypothetical protein